MRQKTIPWFNARPLARKVDRGLGSEEPDSDGTAAPRNAADPHSRTTRQTQQAAQTRPTTTLTTNGNEGDQPKDAKPRDVRAFPRQHGALESRKGDVPNVERHSNAPAAPVTTARLPRDNGDETRPGDAAVLGRKRQRAAEEEGNEEAHENGRGKEDKRCKHDDGKDVGGAKDEEDKGQGGQGSNKEGEKEAGGKEESNEGGQDQDQVDRAQFKAIIDHRPSEEDPNLFDLLVSWLEDGAKFAEHANPGLEKTWVSERIMHEDAPQALFEYWDSVDGGRTSQMADAGLWHMASVTKHRRGRGGKVELLVSWVGSGEQTWEPEASVVDAGGDICQEYWAKKGGRDVCLNSAGSAPGKTTKRRKTKQVRGA